jgi:hypothetical protein
MARIEKRINEIRLSNLMGWGNHIYISVGMMIYSLYHLFFSVGISFFNRQNQMKEEKNDRN